MRCPVRLLACALCSLTLLALSATPSLAQAHHHHHGSKTSTLSSSAPSSVRHHLGHRDRTLPFTGFNLWAYALVGVGMLSAGLLLRRLVAVRR